MSGKQSPGGRPRASSRDLNTGRSQSLRASTAGQPFRSPSQVTPLRQETSEGLGSPGSAQRISPQTGAQTSVRRRLFIGGQSGGPSSTQSVGEVSPLAAGSGPPSNSFSRPSTSQASTPSSSSGGVLSWAWNRFGYGSSKGETPPTSAQSQSTPERQTEPSVRPKGRYRSQPSGFSSSPSPEIVRQFRRPDTGSPDFAKMREMSRPTAPFSRTAGYDLANRSQMEMNNIYGRYGGRSKKEKLLREKDYIYDAFRKRWIRKDWRGPSQAGVERRSLRPRSSDERDLYDDRFQQPLQTMGDRRTSNIMPTGRLGYGPISQTRRSYSMSDLQSLRVPGIKEDPTHWSNRQRAFAERLRGLSKEDLKRYRANRWYADQNQFPGVAERMVQPPTGTNLMDENKSRVSGYMKKGGRAPDRMNRRASLTERSVLESTIFTRDPTVPKKPYPTIPEDRLRNQSGQSDQSGAQQSTLIQRRQQPTEVQPQALPLLQALSQPTAPPDLGSRRQRRWSFDTGELQNTAQSQTQRPTQRSTQRPTQRPKPQMRNKDKEQDDGCSLM